MVHDRALTIGGLLLIAAAVLLAPLVLSGHFVSVFIFAAIYVVILAGLNLFMGFTGQVSFGHNAFAAIGGYSSAILTTTLAWPPLAALAVGMAIAALVAVAVGQPSLRLRGHYLAMATFAFGLITDGIAMQWRGLTRGSFGISAIPPLGIGPWQLGSDRQYYYAYWVIAALALWIAYRAGGTRFGRALRAIAGDERAARALGIDASGYKLGSFVLSAAFAALGGSMFAHYVSFISPEVFGLDMVVTQVTMLFVGGIGTVLGPLWGAVIMSLVPEALRSVSDVRQLAYGIVLLLILMFAPRGLQSLAGHIGWPQRHRAAENAARSASEV
jgi:branched-chain amino acid transport system permease protein